MRAPVPALLLPQCDVAVSKSLLPWFLHLDQEKGLIVSSLETLPAIALMTLGQVSEGLLCQAVPGTQGARSCALDEDSHSKGTSLHSVGEIRECPGRERDKSVRQGEQGIKGTGVGFMGEGH